jgi:hypothetical protein
MLKNYKLKIIESEVQGEEIKMGGLIYRFSCRFVLLDADKIL